MKPVLCFGLLTLGAHGAITTTDTWVVNAAIPDNNPVGLAVTVPVVSPIPSITGLQVKLTISGGWAGDLYAYLAHGSGFAVLLNRIGRSSSVSDGSAANFIQLAFADDAPGDVHLVNANLTSLVGTFQPDARNVDPGVSLDTSPRSAWLASFNGLDANGDWTLYLADVAAGGNMTLESWSVTITGVPEPSATALGLVGLCLACGRRRRPASPPPARSHSRLPTFRSRSGRQTSCRPGSL